MPGLVLLGAQWGDEGKGKVTDILAGQADVVVRYQGGNNAGHTVVVEGKSFALRLLPSGMISGKTECVIGNGVVVDIRVLLDEINYLKENNLDISRLHLSDRSHVIMPYHVRQDELEEQSKGDIKIGTTKNGIGPCYMDKCARIGIRVGDLLNKNLFYKKLRDAVANKNLLFERMYGAEASSFDVDALFEEYLGYAEVIRPYVCDTSVFLDEAFRAGKKVVFEGAQGTLLDLDHGTYPYVTSSNPTAGFACVGAGVGPKRIDEVLGILKAYTTRVGEGPFPTEEIGEVGHLLQTEGHEFGTVTGRTRRCGWLDLVVVRYAARLSGMTRLALMKMDVLDKLSEIKVCTAYRLNGEIINYFPQDLELLDQCEPVYATLPGWQTTTCDCRTFEELPQEAQEYVRFVEKELELPVDMVAVGPDRVETIIRNNIL